MYRYVVTHGGRAHRDELYSLGLAAVMRMISTEIGRATDVFRREPTEEELRDESVLVLDVGSRLEPDLGNFDHHHMERGVEECALSLMARHFTVPDWVFDVVSREKEEKLTFHKLWKEAPWYRAVVAQDALGPTGLAKKLGLKELPEELISGVEAYVLSTLGRSDKVDVYWLSFAQELVWQKVAVAFEFRKKMKELAKEGKIYFIPNAYAMIFDANQTGPFGINQYIETLARKELVWVTISGDPRTGGICLYRTTYGEKRLNFFKLDGRPDMVFAHKSGFMCVAKKDTPIDRLLEMVKQSLL